MEPVTALTVAGSDSGGGAGIQADLRTLSAFGVHATTAITAITAQNTTTVTDVLCLEADLVRAQVDAVVSDFHVRSTKTGMLGQPSTVLEVARLAEEGRLENLVVDPVLVTTTGHSLMSEGGVEAYRDHLLAHATIVTPNLPEAAVLTGLPLDSLADADAMARAGEIILGMGPRAVLVKGGHAAGLGLRTGHSPDILVAQGSVTVLDAPRVATSNDHGTGCSLSAAICAGLALGRELGDAVRDAKSFVLAALGSAATWQLGAGHGPIDHFGWNA